MAVTSWHHHLEKKNALRTGRGSPEEGQGLSFGARAESPLLTVLSPHYMETRVGLFV